MSSTIKKKPSLPKDPFAYIGFWQFMTFIMLLLLVWFNELRDAPELLFDAPPESPNYMRGCVMSAAVLFAAIVTIGNTYLQQKRVLSNLVSVCSNCHKIRVNPETWQRMEDYLGDTTLMSFTHGLCPVCQAAMMETIKIRSQAKLNQKKDM